MRTRQEQILSALCHLFNAIPLWGLLFCGWLWFSLREESRPVVHQARQAMIFHFLMMGAILISIMLEWLSRIIGVVLSLKLKFFLSTLNWWMIMVLLAVYGLICLYGFVRCLFGQPFRYPLVVHRS